MLIHSLIVLYSPYSPLATRAGSSWKQPNQLSGNEPPRKPDWLLVMVVILLLLTVLIAWLVGIPILRR